MKYLYPFPQTLAILAALLCFQPIGEPQANSSQTAELRLRIVPVPLASHQAISAVVWLEPEPGTLAVPFVSRGPYILRQKHKTFTPHLQVIPAGSTVQFPNEDPFFHNVFSLFDGKRFDLGLYEAGSSKSVVFSRKGVSYIFCNIHPEMSAVVVALSSPLYSIADSHDEFLVSDIPPGDYKLSFWIEGLNQAALDSLSRNLHIVGPKDLGAISVPIPAAIKHTNEFGNHYDPSKPSDY